MLSIILGLLTVAIGFYGASHWPSDFFILIRGIFSVSFICGGLVAIAAGIASLKK